jgi:hypothetical protein
MKNSVHRELSKSFVQGPFITLPLCVGSVHSTDRRHGLCLKKLTEITDLRDTD